MTSLGRWRAIVAAACALAACSRGPGEGEATPAAAPVRVEQTTMISRQPTLSAFGTVEISPDHARTISLPYDCVLVALHASAGQDVRAGTVIAEVRPSPAAAVEQRRAIEALRFARSDSARVRRLRAENLATNADVAAAAQALANAEIAVAEMGAPNGATGTQRIVAPISGLIVTLDGQPGAVIAAGTPVAQIGDARQLQARLGVEIVDLANVREGAAATLSDLQHQQSVRGRVTRVLRRVDPTTRLAGVTATLPATSSLLPGAPVRAEIATGESRTVISVSRSALVYTGEAPSVFVVQGGVAHRQAVILGEEFDDRVEVVSGLDANVSVIVDGAATLDDGARVAVQVQAQP